MVADSCFEVVTRIWSGSLAACSEFSLRAAIGLQGSARGIANGRVVKLDAAKLMKR